MGNEKFILPAPIDRFLEGREYTVDDMGLSGSTVILFEDMVLKIEPHSEKADGTVKMMRWLDGKLPVPKVIEYTVEDGKSWLLMSRMMGRMCCDKYYMEHSDEMVSLMAEGLKMLWSIDISDCPREFSLEEDERKALARIKDGRLSAEELAECGFGTAEQMIKWMLENKPAYEPVLSHGDYCLPNVLLENGRISAFIDIGDIGIADKYRDIATCYGSLKNNFGGYFGGRIYEDFDPALLFKKIGGELDPVKIRYSRLIEKVLS